MMFSYVFKSESQRWSWNKDVVSKEMQTVFEHVRTWDRNGSGRILYLNPNAFPKWKTSQTHRKTRTGWCACLDWSSTLQNNAIQCKTSCKCSVAADDWICSAGAAREDIKSQWRLHGHPQTHVLKHQETNSILKIIENPLEIIQDH